MENKAQCGLQSNQDQCGLQSNKAQCGLQSNQDKRKLTFYNSQMLNYEKYNDILTQNSLKTNQIIEHLSKTETVLYYETDDGFQLCLKGLINGHPIITNKRIIQIGYDRYDTVISFKLSTVYTYNESLSEKQLSFIKKALEGQFNIFNFTNHFETLRLVIPGSSNWKYTKENVFVNVETCDLRSDLPIDETIYFHSARDLLLTGTLS